MPPSIAIPALNVTSAIKLPASETGAIALGRPIQPRVRTAIAGRRAKMLENKAGDCTASAGNGGGGGEQPMSGRQAMPDCAAKLARGKALRGAVSRQSHSQLEGRDS